VIYGPGPASSAAHCEWRLAVVEAHPADLPAASLHRTPAPSEGRRSAWSTIASVRMNRPASVFEPYRP
jgi:hypothetical protein